MNHVAIHDNRPGSPSYTPTWRSIQCSPCFSCDREFHNDELTEYSNNNDLYSELYCEVCLAEMVDHMRSVSSITRELRASVCKGNHEADEQQCSICR